MKAHGFVVATLLLCALPAFGDEADETEAATGEAAASEQSAAEQPAAEQPASEPQGDGIDTPKTMSGMSILGNEEAPKSLVIIPWKSSELGDNISLSDSLDDRARPVDREVFLRELHFHEIRSGN